MIDKKDNIKHHNFQTSNLPISQLDDNCPMSKVEMSVKDLTAQ